MTEGPPTSHLDAAARIGRDTPSGRLASFRRLATTGLDISPDRDAHVSFAKSLAPDRLPTTLKAVLAVIGAGATPKMTQIEFTFIKGVAENGSGWETPGGFNISWQGKENKDYAHATSGINSISVSVSDSPDKNWKVTFHTDDKTYMVDSLLFPFDPQLKWRNPELFARLQTLNNIGSSNFKLTFQEELASLLDPYDGSAKFSAVTEESDSFRRRQEDERRGEAIAERVAGLTAIAERLLKAS